MSESGARSSKLPSSDRPRLAQEDVRAHALHILPPPRTESHKCAVMIHIAARVCAAPASNEAVRINPYRTVFV